MEAGLGRGDLLQRAVPAEPQKPADGLRKLKREFSSREELARYLQEQFPRPAQRDAHLSPIRGGRSQAEAALAPIQPARYAFTRNYLDGCVTGLSPYIRHGVIALTRVREVALSRVAHPFHASKFVVELAWRDYWRRLYGLWGQGVWQDREPYKTGWAASDYAESLPVEVEQGRTGLACMDAFARQLAETGYLHNHARMWVAAWVVHWLRVKWQAGARWFLKHLLDGDPASNNLSWQWVASTFSHKPYFFNRENLEKYTRGAYCQKCPQRGDCPFEGSYEELHRKLFRSQVEG